MKIIPAIRPLIRLFAESLPDGIHPNVVCLFDIVFRVAQAMIKEIALPMQLGLLGDIFFPLEKSLPHILFVRE